MENKLSTYWKKTRSNGEILVLEWPCIILEETENSYKIQILNWYDDNKPIKFVRKNHIKRIH
jgi:hypothetical protein